MGSPYGHISAPFHTIHENFWFMFHQLLTLIKIYTPAQICEDLAWNLLHRSLTSARCSIMKAKDTRKSIAAAKALCKSRGITLLIVKDDGKGSHQALIFSDDATGEAVKVVIAGGAEISPGVQRRTLQYLRDMSSVLKVAEAVRQILDSVFGGGN
jgi:hypothetical protein